MEKKINIVARKIYCVISKSNIDILSIGDTIVNIQYRNDGSAIITNAGIIETIWLDEKSILIKKLETDSINNITRSIFDFRKNTHIFVEKSIVLASDLDGIVPYQLELF